MQGISTSHTDMHIAVIAVWHNVKYSCQFADKEQLAPITKVKPSQRMQLKPDL